MKEEQNEINDNDFNFENQIHEESFDDLRPYHNDGTPILQGVQYQSVPNGRPPKQTKFQSVPIGRPPKQTKKETNCNKIKEEWNNPNKNDTSFSVTSDQDPQRPLAATPVKQRARVSLPYDDKKKEGECKNNNILNIPTGDNIYDTMLKQFDYYCYPQSYENNFKIEQEEIDNANKDYSSQDTNNFDVSADEG